MKVYQMRYTSIYTSIQYRNFMLSWVEHKKINFYKHGAWAVELRPTSLQSLNWRLSRLSWMFSENIVALFSKSHWNKPSGVFHYGSVNQTQRLLIRYYMLILRRTTFWHNVNCARKKHVIYSDTQVGVSYVFNRWRLQESLVWNLLSWIQPTHDYLLDFLSSYIIHLKCSKSTLIPFVILKLKGNPVCICIWFPFHFSVK